MKIEIYGRDHCPYCVNAKKAFQSAGYKYTEHTIGKGHTKEDVQKRVDALGIPVVISTVPQIFIDDEYIGGYTDLVKRFEWAKNFHKNK